MHGSRCRARIWAFLIASALAVAPPTVMARAEPSSLDEARRYYEDGRAAFDTADYDGAVKFWTRAYARLPDTEASRKIRIDIVYNIATAQVEGYELDGDIGRLRRARVLLRKYMAEYIDVTEDMEGMVAETEKVRRKLREVEAALAKAEQGRPQPPPTTGPATAPSPNGTPAEPRNRPSKPDQPKLDRMQIGGIVALSAVALTLGLTIGGAVMVGNGNDEFEDPDTRDDGRKKIRNGTALAITGGVVSAGLIATGIALLVIGKKRRQNRTSFEPVFSPNVVAASWQLRF